MEVDDEIEEGMVVDDDDSTPPVPSEAKAGTFPYEILKQRKASAEEIVAKMLEVKKRGGSKSELRELIAQMFLNFVSLRQANRSILLEEDRVKAETDKAKAPVDFTTLQLHNLMYEKNHYVKAIKACKDFKSKYPDIELVSEEEFLKDAPEEIKGATISDDSEHNVMLKRLNYELYQRKELCKLKEKLEQKKKDIQETIANRKKFLSSLPSHLKSLKKASLPVQSQLGVLHTKKLKQHNSAELLPPPLYVIFSQLLAQKEAFEENIDLEIVGSVKDAQLCARQQATKDNGHATNVENSRMEDDAIDDEDDGQRRRKRPKKAISGKDGIEEDKVYQAHPLKIILHVFDDEESESKNVKLLTLKFEYLLKLNVVCVGIEGSDETPENSILCNLFPDDAGVELPLESAKLSVGEAFVFDEKRSSRPYKWAQHLGGIDFLPEVPPLLASNESPGVEMSKSATVAAGLSLYRQENRVQTIVQRLRSRKKAQLALQEQLDSLLKLQWPPLMCENAPWALQAHSCDIQSCSHIDSFSSVTSIASEQTSGAPEKDANGKIDNSKDEVEGAREDGELPSLVPVVNVSSDLKANFDHGKRVALISKAVPSPMNKSKSQSFKKLDEDPDLMLESDGEYDEPAKNDAQADDLADSSCSVINAKPWENYGVAEFSLVMMKKIESSKTNTKLEARIIVSMEYPLRPSLFHVNIYTASADGSCPETEVNEWYNESRAIEAEVNLRVLRMVPRNQENYVLAHQVHCLALLFELYMDEAYLSSDGGKAKRACDKINNRSIRGRDRRKMISWNDIESAKFSNK
uniref:THO complex subunit 5 n=1 Tax=Kalanchoe fedtschenkoi TaxID=63787 RepID=A0A7N0TQ76_KALFE